MVKYNVTVHYRGTNDKPEAKQFYILEYPLSYRAALETVAKAIDNSMHVITGIEITATDERPIE